MKRFLLGGLLILPAAQAAAEMGGSKSFSMPELVVTETKVSQPQTQVTQRIDVVYPDDVARQTTYNRNISEILKYNSGLFVDVLSRNDANWGSFGGLGPKYTPTFWTVCRSTPSWIP